VKLTDPDEIRAAIVGGTEGWGQWGSAADHVRYIKPIRPQSRRRCWCGCRTRETHAGLANGVVLTIGCELSMRRWAKAAAG
jgi:hypothetical protein